jgi:predicted phage baseplate assembly protein
VPALPPYQLKTEGVPGEADRIFEITEEFSLKKLNSSIDLSTAGVPAAALPTAGQALQLPRAIHALGPGALIYFEQQTPVTGGSPRIRRSPILRVVKVDAVSATDDIITWLPPLPDPFAPALTTLKGNNVRATHGETVANEPVVIGDGTPGQRMILSRQPVSHVLARGITGRSTAELEVRVNGEVWDEVTNFIDSGPSDTHYVTSIDENDYLTVIFGTGDRGSVVPAGAQITARYRIGLGSDGNVGSDRLTVFLSSVPEVSAISNPFNAEGGADRESLEEAKISGPGSVIAQQRAVTIEDYELLAKGFPGVGKARASVGLRGGYKVVQLVVAPANPTAVPPPAPAAELKDALKEYLEARQPVNRMAGVDVLDPIYVPINVTVDVHAKAQVSRSQVLADVLAVLHDYLSFPRQEFGQAVRVGEIFSLLYPVEGVAYLTLRRLERGDHPVKPPAGCDFTDVGLGDRELAFEGVLTVNVFGGIK